MNTASIVQKLWNYCNVLRDDGISYGDYPGSGPGQAVEQFTCLLFLKMADERTRPGARVDSRSAFVARP
jgi:type I restriction enzyme M protein